MTAANRFAEGTGQKEALPNFVLPGGQMCSACGFTSISVSDLLWHVLTHPPSAKCGRVSSVEVRHRFKHLVTVKRVNITAYVDLAGLDNVAVSQPIVQEWRKPYPLLTRKNVIT